MPAMPLFPAVRHLIGALVLAGAALPTSAANDLVVRVVGLQAPIGAVGCALFSDATGFPLDNTGAQQQWVPAGGESVTCRFAGLKPGRYAVAIAHDLNGNRRVDTNLLGMPTEQWGVSNAVRPTLRAPRYDEAAFVLPAQAPEHVITIEVAK